MIKLDFLAKLRIKNEVSSSDEKLSMLMPDFILKRMNNFEMSSKRKNQKITNLQKSAKKSQNLQKL